MQRTLVLTLGVLIIFATVAAILLELMPAPMKDSDYLVAGSVATLVALLALFLLLAATSQSGNAFFKKRKKSGR